MTSFQGDKPRGFNPEVRNSISRLNRRLGQWGYLVIWEFQVREGMEKRFEMVYGSQGDWARFFAQDESYLKTELVHESTAGRTYLTLDFWTSNEAYENFRKRFCAKYEALDEKCQNLTESEREIGRFERALSK